MRCVLPATVLQEQILNNTHSPKKLQIQARQDCLAQFCRANKDLWLHPHILCKGKKLPILSSLIFSETPHWCFRDRVFHFSSRVPVTRGLKRDWQRAEIGTEAFSAREFEPSHPCLFITS